MYCSAAQYPHLSALGEELRFLMITSATRVHEIAEAPPGAIEASAVAGGGVWIRVRRTEAPARKLKAAPGLCRRVNSSTGSIG